MKNIVLINLLPNDRMVLRHFRRLERMIRSKMLIPVMVQPNNQDTLRRVLSLTSDLFYLVGHATPSEGIQIGNNFLKWQEWSQCYHEALPRQLIFNICYGAPGTYWQLAPSLSSKVIGHNDLVERNWAMQWGEKEIVKVIASICQSAPLP